MRLASDGSSQASLFVVDCRAGRLVFRRAGTAYAGSDELSLEPTEHVQYTSQQFYTTAGNNMTMRNQGHIFTRCCQSDCG